MQYRTDHKTGNQLSALGLGCMRFPKAFENTEKLVLDAIQGGVNYFDTAYIYGNSEETLGKILDKHSLRQDIFLATKLPIVYCRSSSDFDKYFNRQLQRLKTDFIDYYLIHMLTDMKRWETLCEWGIEDWIRKKKESGQIRQIGFSFHGPQDEFLALLDVYDWEFCMIQYNYSDEHFQAGATGLRKAAQKGLPVFVMEPLLGGRLVHKLPPEAVQIFHKANPDLSPAAFALKWVWNQPEVTLLLSGMNHSDQLKENISIAETALPFSLTETENAAFAQVLQVFSKTFKVRCTGCNYCVPCPQYVNIPACFSSYNTSFSMGRTKGLKHYFMSTGGLSHQQGYASKCIKCGKCEQQCPQHISIMESLDLVQKRLEPPGAKAALGIVRGLLGITRK